MEHLGDLMGILCSCLQDYSARSTFLQAEGIELMLLIIKQKRTARTGALKARLCPNQTGALPWIDSGTVSGCADYLIKQMI